MRDLLKISLLVTGLLLIVWALAGSMPQLLAVLEEHVGPRAACMLILGCGSLAAGTFLRDSHSQHVIEHLLSERGER